MTSMIDGLTIGWSECSRCLTHFTRCACPEGSREPSNVARTTPVEGRVVELRGTITVA